MLLFSHFLDSCCVWIRFCTHYQSKICKKIGNFLGLTRYSLVQQCNIFIKNLHMKFFLCLVLLSSSCFIEYLNSTRGTWRYHNSFILSICRAIKRKKKMSDNIYNFTIFLHFFTTYKHYKEKNITWVWENKKSTCVTRENQQRNYYGDKKVVQLCLCICVW